MNIERDKRIFVTLANLLHSAIALAEGAPLA